MDLYQALENRRSVRKYTADPVADAQLRKLLDAARIAPSWSNMQGWKFLVVRDQQKKEQLAASLPEKNPAFKAMTRASVVIVLCADPKASGNQDGKDYYLLDAGQAMLQFMLAAHAEGLGTCWVAWFDEAKAREACKVPPGQRIVALSPLGVPERQPLPRPRKELGEIVFAEEWGKVWS
jgi:nitroreductase